MEEDPLRLGERLAWLRVVQPARNGLGSQGSRTGRPSALVLEEATQVEAVAEDLVPPSLREAIAPGRDVAPTRAADLVLDQPGQVVCPYDANPATTARTWKGPADCSLCAWFADEPDGFRIRAVVTDDILNVTTALTAPESSALRLKDW